MRATIIKDNAKDIKKTTRILIKSLKKGDIILTRPNKLDTIKLITINIWSFLISKVGRGVTHSCFYLGNGYVIESGRRITDKKIQKISLEKLLRDRFSIFKGVTVYIVQPKIYNEKHRKIALEFAVNKFLKKTENIAFSYIEVIKVGLRYIFHKSEFYKDENLDKKKKWNCSTMIAHIIKKSGAHIGKRNANTFLPDSFLFSKHFKTKKKFILK